jgi:hypothetical protein
MGIEELETDAAGNLLTRPILGCIVAPIGGMAILLKLQYAERPEELKTGGRSLQFVMTPQQGLEIAETLTKQARRILDAPPPALSS